MKHSPTHLALLCTVLASAQSTSADILALGATDDSYIRASQTNQGANHLVLVGDTTTANDFLRGVFAFDLSNPLLTGATINSVTLTLTIRERDISSGGSVNETVTLNLHELSASFIQGNSSVGSGVTWTSRDGTNDWSTPGGDFGGVLASDTANAATVNALDTVDFSGSAFTSAAISAVGGSLYLLAKLDVENSTRTIFRFAANENSYGVPGPKLTIDYTPAPADASPHLIDFQPDPDGSSQVSICGAAGARYKVVEAVDLDFSNPDQDPVPLTAATVGTLDGNEVILDGAGNATVEFVLDPAKPATFIRAEEVP